MESFDQVAKHYEPMIYKIMHTLHIYKNQEEFYQQGLIALWEASRRFDPAKGSFTSYAYNYVKGYLLTEISRANRYEEKCTVAKDEYWDSLEDVLADIPLEEDIILSYCRMLTENQKKWVLYTALKNLSINEIAKLEHVSPSAVKLWRKGAKEKIRNGMMKS